jgi:hypothetical protein
MAVDCGLVLVSVSKGLTVPVEKASDSELRVDSSRLESSLTLTHDGRDFSRWRRRRRHKIYGGQLESTQCG